MKEADINLIPQRKEDNKNQNRTMYGSLGIFFAIFLVGAMLILYSLFLKSNLTSLNTTEQNIQAQISAISLKKEKILLIKERAQTVKQVLVGRDKVTTDLQTVFSAIPESFNVETIQADEKGMSFVLSGTSLGDFNTLLEETIPSLTGNKKLGILSVDIIDFDQAGSSYRMDLAIHTAVE